MPGAVDPSPPLRGSPRAPRAVDPFPLDGTGREGPYLGRDLLSLHSAASAPFLEKTVEGARITRAPEIAGSVSEKRHSRTGDADQAWVFVGALITSEARALDSSGPLPPHNFPGGPLLDGLPLGSLGTEVVGPLDPMLSSSPQILRSGPLESEYLSSPHQPPVPPHPSFGLFETSHAVLVSPLHSIGTPETFLNDVVSPQCTFGAAENLDSRLVSPQIGSPETGRHVYEALDFPDTSALKVYSRRRFRNLQIQAQQDLSSRTSQLHPEGLSSFYGSCYPS